MPDILNHHIKSIQNSTEAIASEHFKIKENSFILCPKPNYLRFKPKLQKEKNGRSLHSIETQRQSNCSKIKSQSKRIFSHRKLISSDLDQNSRPILFDRNSERVAKTDRKLKVEHSERNRTGISESRKNIIEEIYGKNLRGVKNYSRKNILKIHSTIESKKNLHASKFTKFRHDQLHTIDGKGEVRGSVDKKERKSIIKGCIEHLQGVLNELEEQEENTFRIKENPQMGRLKTETAKKDSRSPLNELSALNNQLETINPHNADRHGGIKHSESTHFGLYLEQIKRNQNENSFNEGKRDQKIILKKNAKKSYQALNRPKIANKVKSEAFLRQGLICSQKGDQGKKKHQFDNQTKEKEKTVFKHLRKYDLRVTEQPRESVVEREEDFDEVIQLSPVSPKEQPSDVRNRQRKKSLSSTENPFCIDPELVDCSSIQQTNQSSFISEAGKNTLIKEFEKKADLGIGPKPVDLKGIKKTLEYYRNGNNSNNRSSKKSLLKLNKRVNSNFPEDFF